MEIWRVETVNLTFLTCVLKAQLKSASQRKSLLRLYVLRLYFLLIGSILLAHPLYESNRFHISLLQSLRRNTTRYGIIV